MIKKDISYSNVDCKLYEHEKSNTSSVDDIFASADNTMDAQNRSLLVNFKDKKKKKHPILRLIVSVLLFFLVLVGGLVGLGIHYIKTTYPQIKETFLDQVSSMREVLMAMDDSELTIDQYYQKQILILFTREDLEAAFGDIENIDTILQVITSGGELDLSVLPEEKVNAYNKLLEEYKHAKANEEVSSSELTQENTTEYVEDIQEIETSERN